LPRQGRQVLRARVVGLHHGVERAVEQVEFPAKILETLDAYEKVTTYARQE
jgi:hypothetical protein